MTVLMSQGRIPRAYAYLSDGFAPSGRQQMLMKRTTYTFAVLGGVGSSRGCCPDTGAPPIFAVRVKVVTELHAAARAERKSIDVSGLIARRRRRLVIVGAGHLR